jgi:hypothetical protein
MRSASVPERLVLVRVMAAEAKATKATVAAMIRAIIVSSWVQEEIRDRARKPR